MDALTAQLLSAQSAAESAAAAAAAAAPDAACAAADDDAALETEMVAFDAVFDKIKSLKAEAIRAREGGGGAGGPSMSDAERRKRAEDTVMQLLKSMGMEDKLETDDEADSDETKQEAK